METSKTSWSCLPKWKVAVFGGVDGFGRDPLFQRRDQGEGLDRGARLAVPLGRQVEGLGVEVGAADHRLDPGVVVVDHHHRGGRRRVAEVGVDRFFGRFLQPQVERRLDFEAAEEGLGGAVAFDQLLAQVGGEVGGPRVEASAVRCCSARAAPAPGLRASALRRCSPVRPSFRAPCCAGQRVFGVDLGVVGRGRGDDRRQRRRLPGLEHRGAGFGRGAAAGVGGAEVGARGRLDPVGALAEVDRVQVLGEDLVLAPVALEPVGERRLAELLQDRAAAFGFERVLDELLGDRRGALGGALAEDVLDEGAADALEVDAVVFVEAGVLDRDHRVLDVGGDLRGAEEDFVLVAGQRPDRFAVVVDRPRCSSRPCTGRSCRSPAGPARPPPSSRRSSRPRRGRRARAGRRGCAASSAAVSCVSAGRRGGGGRNSPPSLAGA